MVMGRFARRAYVAILFAAVFMLLSACASSQTESTGVEGGDYAEYKPALLLVAAGDVFVSDRESCVNLCEEYGFDPDYYSNLYYVNTSGSFSDEAVDWLTEFSNAADGDMFF